MQRAVKRSQHWLEAALCVPLVREGGGGSRGSPLGLVWRDWSWWWWRWRGGGGGRQGLVDQDLVRGGKAVQAVHGPVGAHHLLVGDEGLVVLAERHELRENIFLVLEVLLDGHQDGLGVGLLAHHVALLLVLGDQGLDWSWQGGGLLPDRSAGAGAGTRTGGGCWSPSCYHRCRFDRR